MLGSLSTYDNKKHALIGGEIGAFVDRMSEKSGRDLFVLRYNALEVFCICEWMAPNHSVFIDVMNLGKSLANFTFEKSQEFRKRLFAPLTAQETSVSIANAESDYLHMRQDDNAEEHERLERIARGE